MQQIGIEIKGSTKSRSQLSSIESIKRTLHNTLRNEPVHWKYVFCRSRICTLKTDTTRHLLLIEEMRRSRSIVTECFLRKSEMMNRNLLPSSSCRCYRRYKTMTLPRPDPRLGSSQKPRIRINLTGLSAQRCEDHQSYDVVKLGKFRQTFNLTLLYRKPLAVAIMYIGQAQKRGHKYGARSFATWVIILRCSLTFRRSYRQGAVFDDFADDNGERVTFDPYSKSQP